jgi:hypothetical protein
MPTYWRSSALKRYNAGVTLLDRSEEEKLCFEFFCKCPSLKISGMFKSDFWDHFLIQASMVEPAIFHGVLAIGSAYRINLIRSEAQDCGHAVTELATVRAHETSALRHYNKAIKQLGRILENKDAYSLRIATITCMLFICLEMVQGQTESMESHCRYAPMLFQAMQAHPKQIEDEYLIQAFARLCTPLDLVNQNLPSLKTVTRGPSFIAELSIPRLFNTVPVAKASLERLLNSIMDLRAEAEQFTAELPPVQADLVHRQANLQASINKWKDAYQCTIKTISAQFSFMEQIGLRLLRLYHTMATVLLGTCLSQRREISYDAFTSSFASTLSQFEDILKLIGWFDPQSPGRELCGSDSSFSIDMGSFPPMYFLALKCRDPGIRRRAIYLLGKAKHKEGMWTGAHLSRIAAKLISLEEVSSLKQVQDDLASGTRYGRLTAAQQLKSSEIERLVPEQSRFHRVKINVSGSGPSRVAKLTCTRFKHGGDGDQLLESTCHEVYLN